jgi:hypothetical protein
LNSRVAQRSSLDRAGYLHQNPLRFYDSRYFGAGRGSDVIDGAAVGGRLLAGGLEQALLQRDQLVRVLDGQGGLGRLRGFGHRDLGGRDVEFDQLLDAFEDGATEAVQRGDVGLLGVDDLFNGNH